MNCRKCGVELDPILRSASLTCTSCLQAFLFTFKQKEREETVRTRFEREPI